VPAALRAAEPGALLRDVLDELASTGRERPAGEPEERTGDSCAPALEAVLARMACHGSPRDARQLEEPEVLALLASLDQLDLKASGPRRRPILLRLSRHELEQRLGRG